MTEDQDSGQAILRRALATRNRKFNISLMARDLSIAPSALEEFAHGTASLTPEVLKALAGIVLDADYDPNLDKLRPLVKQEAKSIGSVPRSITSTMKLPTFKPGPPPAQPGMVTPSPPRTRRAGWVE